MTVPVSRRRALHWMLGAYAALHAFSIPLARGDGSAARGYGGDPDLLRMHAPGELWDLTLDSQARALAARLCDLVLPEAPPWPSASAVGVVDFLDEWVSAPYAQCRDDASVIVPGLHRFGSAAGEISGTDPSALTADTLAAIWEAQARADDGPAEFLARFRRLTAIGYYTTPKGMEDLGYTGNRPSARFDGPPLEALRQAGVRVPGETSSER